MKPNQSHRRSIILFKAINKAIKAINKAITTNTANIAHTKS